MSASNLLINFVSIPPTAFSLNECLDMAIDFINVGSSTATGTNYIFVGIMNGWSYNWNPSQTIYTNILNQNFVAHNSQFNFQPIILGESYLAGYQLSTNETLSPGETIRFALQVCAPNFTTSRVLNGGILKNSQGDNTFDNNLISLGITSF
jgi:hypothetical protein